MTSAAVVAYHRQNREVKISYAGHPPVLYKRSTDKSWAYIRRLKTNWERQGFPLNLPLAIDETTQYPEISLPVLPGDRFIIYTDGIIDTPNILGKPFGLTRLKNVLDENSESPLPVLKSAVLKRLERFSENALNHDDITLIVLEIS